MITLELLNEKTKRPELIVEVDEDGTIWTVQAYVPAYDDYVTVGEITAFVKKSTYWLERIETAYQEKLESFKTRREERWEDEIA